MCCQQAVPTDLTDQSSFERAKFWVNELKQTEEVCVWFGCGLCDEPNPAIQECIVYLCGTKVDLVEENKKARKVDVHMVRDYAEGQC